MKTELSTITFSRRGEGKMLFCLLAGEKGKWWVYLVARLSDVRWWDITANSSRRTKTAPWWLN